MSTSLQTSRITSRVTSRKWLSREVDGRCRRNTSRSETLCGKAFSSKTGGREVGFAALARELYWRWPRGQHVLFINISRNVFQFQLGIHAFELGELCFRTLGDMLSDSQSIAFGLSEHCFQTLKALLSERQSIAFRRWEHCFWNLRVLLLTTRSTSLDHKEQYSRCYGACLYIHTEHCSR
jgi:hypothetical protein